MKRSGDARDSESASSPREGPASRVSAIHLLCIALLSIPILFFDLGSYGFVNDDEAFYHYLSRHMVETVQ